MALEAVELVREVAGVVKFVLDLIQTYKDLKDELDFLSVRLAFVIQLLADVEKNTALEARFPAVRPLCYQIKTEALYIQSKVESYAGLKGKKQGLGKKVFGVGKKVKGFFQAGKVLEALRQADDRIDRNITMLTAATVAMIAHPDKPIPPSKSLFNKYKRGGRLGAVEFRRLALDLHQGPLSLDEAQAAVKQLDTDGDGTVDYEEFLSWWDQEDRWGALDTGGGGDDNSGSVAAAYTLPPRDFTEPPPADQFTMPTFAQLYEMGANELVGDQAGRRTDFSSAASASGPATVKIVHVADTHMLLTADNALKHLPDGDVLVVSGDFTNFGTNEELAEFDKVLGALKNKYAERVVVPGTGDVRVYEGACDIVRAQLLNATHVPLHEKVILESGLVVYGLPWFHGHRYNYQNFPGVKVTSSDPAGFGGLASATGVDIVVSHGPAHGTLDECDGVKGNHCGSTALRDALQKARPGLHLFGKYHEQNGVSGGGGGSLLSVNSALKNRFGKRDWLENPPHVITATRSSGKWSFSAATAAKVPTPPSIGTAERPLRIVHISDSHTLLRASDIPDGDVLLSSGDFSLTGTAQEIQAFDDVLRTLRDQNRFSDIVVCPGRADVRQLKDDLEALRGNLTSAAVPLYDLVTVSAGLRIYSSPWYYNHDYKYDPYNRAAPGDAKFDLIPDNTDPDTAFDVLLTHGAPRGILDEADNKKGNHTGSSELLEAVRKAKPGLHAFGGIHEQHGTKTEGGTLFVNSALLDRWSSTPKLGQKPHVIEGVKSDSGAWSFKVVS